MLVELVDIFDNELTLSKGSSSYSTKCVIPSDDKCCFFSLVIDFRS